MTTIFELCDVVRETSFAIHKYHGHGHLEKVYENALAHRLRKAGLKVQQQHPIKVYDEDGTEIGDYLADLFIEDQLIVELKAAKNLADEHVAQVLGYLKSARIEHGLLINFGSYRFQIKKYALSADAKRPAGTKKFFSFLFAFFALLCGQSILMHASAVFAADLSSQPGIIKSEFLFDPAPHPQCHSSTIVETENGLAAAWFGGTREGNPDVGIWLTREVNGQWTKPEEVANGAETETPRVNCLNPVLFQVPNGPLLLFYKTGQWWAYVKRSTDHGATWSPPERLYNGFFGPVKNKPVLLSDGSILSPSSTEFASTQTNILNRAWQVHFERSTNGGRSWQRIGPINEGLEIHAIQPSILFHGEGKLQALGRTAQGRLFEVWSEDNGMTWGEMSLMDLPNNNSGTDAVTLRDGRHILVYNHTGNRTDHDRPNGYRSPLNVAISKDGKHWEAALVLENQPRREFSYPAVIQTQDGLVHITYTWRREFIKHVVVDPMKLETRPIKDGEWPE